MATENVEMLRADSFLREISPRVSDARPFVVFLHDLMRDHLSIGTVTDLVFDSDQISRNNVCTYSNGWLASLAQSFADKLLGDEYGKLLKLKEIVANALQQQGDDVCWKDIYNSEVAALVGVIFDPQLLPKPCHMENCDHFYDCLAANVNYEAPCQPAGVKKVSS